MTHHRSDYYCVDDRRQEEEGKTDEETQNGKVEITFKDKQNNCQRWPRMLFFCFS